MDFLSQLLFFGKFGAVILTAVLAMKALPSPAAPGSTHLRNLTIASAAVAILVFFGDAAVQGHSDDKKQRETNELLRRLGRAVSSTTEWRVGWTAVLPTAEKSMFGPRAPLEHSAFPSGTNIRDVARDLVWPDSAGDPATYSVVSSLYLVTEVFPGASTESECVRRAARTRGGLTLITRQASRDSVALYRGGRDTLLYRTLPVLSQRSGDGTVISIEDLKRACIITHVSTSYPRMVPWMLPPDSAALDRVITTALRGIRLRSLSLQADNGAVVDVPIKEAQGEDVVSGGRYFVHLFADSVPTRPARPDPLEILETEFGPVTW
jgi:hypothetical protein